MSSIINLPSLIHHLKKINPNKINPTTLSRTSTLLCSYKGIDWYEIVHIMKNNQPFPIYVEHNYALEFMKLTYDKTTPLIPQSTYFFRVLEGTVGIDSNRYCTIIHPHPLVREYRTDHIDDIDNITYLSSKRYEPSFVLSCRVNL